MLFYAPPRIKIPDGANATDMEYLLIFTTGGLLYGLMELVWRGWTHWSMLICGGLCMSIMYLISASALPFALKLILSALSVTAVEFTAGCLVNLCLGWQVWDYSALRWNLLGQVCPQFFLLWLGLSVPGLMLCRLLRSLLG